MVVDESFLSRPRRRVYKLWRYPGVPIPWRLQRVYSSDPQKCRK